MIILPLGPKMNKLGKSLVTISNNKWEMHDTKSFIPHMNSHKEYNDLDLDVPEEILKGDKITILVNAGTDISGVTLKLAEKLVDSELYLIYCRRNPDGMIPKSKQIEQLTFGVLKEYARSGKFSKMIIYDPEIVWQNCLPDTGLMDYENNVARMVAYYFYLLHYLPGQDTVTESFGGSYNTARIGTFAQKRLDSTSLRMFYDLGDAIEINSYYYLSENTLKNNKDVLGNIKAFSKENNKQQIANSYKVYLSPHDEDLVMCLVSSNNPQKVK